MERISDLERKYVNEALDNAFATSKNSIFNSRLEKEFAEKFDNVHFNTFLVDCFLIMYKNIYGCQR